MLPEPIPEPMKWYHLLEVIGAIALLGIGCGYLGYFIRDHPGSQTVINLTGDQDARCAKVVSRVYASLQNTEGVDECCDPP